LRSGAAALVIKFAYSDGNAWDHEMLFNDTRVFRSPGIFLHPVITPRLNGRTLEPCHVIEDNAGAWVASAEGRPMQLVDLRFNLLLCHERLLAAMEGTEVSEPAVGLRLERSALKRLDGGALDVNDGDGDVIVAEASSMIGGFEEKCVDEVGLATGGQCSSSAWQRAMGSSVWRHGAGSTSLTSTGREWEEREVSE